MLLFSDNLNLDLEEVVKKFDFQYGKMIVAYSFLNILRPCSSINRCKQFSLTVGYILSVCSPVKEAHRLCVIEEVDIFRKHLLPFSVGRASPLGCSALCSSTGDS